MRLGTLEMKRFYDKSEHYTKKASDVSKEIERFVIPIIQKYADLDYSIVELQQIFHNCISYQSAMIKAKKHCQDEIKKKKKAVG